MSKIFFVIIITFVSVISIAAQTGNQNKTADSEVPLIVPDGKTLDSAYFKPKSLFYKLTWLDKNNKIVREMTLNIVTEINAANNRLTFKQIRNDGKVDTSVAKLSTLEPVNVSSISATAKYIYDYSAGQVLKARIEQNGKVEFDGNYKMPRPYFDSFLTDHVLGALPLQPGYTAQFDLFRGDTKRDGTMIVRKVTKDALLSENGKIVPVFFVLVELGQFEYLYSIDMQTREILKCFVSSPDGSMFVRAKI